MNRWCSFFSLLLLSLLFFAGPSADGQSLHGSIAGRVTDASNRPIPNADITLVQQETNRERRAKTGPSGEFVVLLLPVGTYKVEANSAGYRKSSRTVILLVNQEVKVFQAKLSQGPSDWTECPSPK